MYGDSNNKPMNGENLLEARDLRRVYGGRVALDGVGFTAARGQITGFLGPNGAGKSTLMQILCGVLAPTSGTVTIAGHDLLDSPLEAKRRLGYLPEQPPVYTDCTVAEYLDYCARLRGLRGPPLARAVEACIARCGLADASGRLIGNLSKGYRQRAGLAQALVHEPDVVVLDEPSSGLDPRQTLEFGDLIRSLGRERCVILSTHHLAEARSLCDRVLIMRGGKVAMDADIGALAAAGDHRVVTAGFRNPPADTAALAALEGVLDVRPAGGRNRYRITCTGDPAVLSTIAEAAAAREWGLTELAGGAEDLEQAYVRLTGEPQAAETP